MSLEDRIRTSVDAALDHLRTHFETDMRQLVDQLVASAAQEREEAINTARRAAFDEAWQNTQREITEAESRFRAAADQTLASVRDQERAEAERRVSEALAAGEARQASALADADWKAAQVLKESVETGQARLKDAETGRARLLESVRALDAAPSLSEVLDVLGDAAGREVARAAVLVVRNNRLLGWKLSGFGDRDSQPKTIDLGLDEGGVVTNAVNTASRAMTREGQVTVSGPVFAHLPEDRLGLAVPVIVGGRVVAVVYADPVREDGRGPSEIAGWPDLIEILTRHAARCLEALTVQKTTAAPSPRFWVPAAGQPLSATAGHVAPPGDRG